MDKKYSVLLENKGTESFRRKTDIFYGDPVELLEMAKSGGITVEELQEFLIQIKRPAGIEKSLIKTTHNVELLVTKILEEQAETIDYSAFPSGEDEGTPEDFIPMEELLERELSQLKEKMNTLFTQEVEEIDPNVLERGDILDIQFFYTRQEIETRFTIVFSVSGLYSAKIIGKCFLGDFHDTGKVVSIPFSMAITDKIYRKGQRPVNIFHNGNFSEIPQLVRSGLHERYIVKMQIFSKEEKKNGQEGLRKYFFWRKK